MKERKDKIGLTFAWQGLLKVIAEETNFRIHLIVGIFVIATGLFIRLNYLEWAIILMVICLVLVTEILNTLVERVIDYFKPEKHEKAKHIKDISASAVLITAFFALIIGLIIFIPKFIHL